MVQPHREAISEKLEKILSMQIILNTDFKFTCNDTVLDVTLKIFSLNKENYKKSILKPVGFIKLETM